MSSMKKLTALAFAAFALSSCTGSGVANDPVSRAFQWYGTLAADDIRRSCVPGAPEHWRFIYNGVYTEQVRAYEIRGGVVETRVFDQLNLLDLDLYRTDQFVRGVRSANPISAEELQKVAATWQADLAVAAKPGEHLRSDRFYWTTAACRDGKFTFAAFLYPNTGGPAFSFPGELVRYDTTGKQVNRPRTFDRDVLIPSDYQVRRDNGGDGPRFLMRVVENGARQGY